jgi:large subunit ribosomal protein L6
MSKIGKKPILIPTGVSVVIEGNRVAVKGSKGELSHEFSSDIKIEMRDNSIYVTPLKEDKKVRALWGLTRQLIYNMIKGVSEGYEKKLELEGIGFRAVLEGENLILHLGFSHPVKVEKVPGIKFSVDKNIITISGIDKELVGQVAASIKRIKKPDPYKGKGIKYVGEQIRKKVGKKAAAAK